MELLEQSSNEDAASNIDTDADIVEFDTDLPAAHNVCTFLFLLFWISNILSFHLF